MEHILGASCVFVCDEGFRILEDGGVLIAGDRILELGDYAELKAHYPKLPSEFHQDCVLLPALCNAHIHFEFSNNKATLLYGDFPSWLGSVITHREELFENLQASIEREIALQLSSGVATVGAISSHGLDILPLAHSPLRVVLFNEAIGSNPQALDFLYANLIERLELCKSLRSHSFHPALALHSPYSVHRLLASKVADLARAEGLRLSCHFLESKEEREWLYEQKGWFKEFFEHFFQIQDAKPSMDAFGFIDLLEGLSPLFVHCLFADEEVLHRIAELGGFLVSAPRSNRLLNARYLDLSLTQKARLPVAFATDGLSSNASLNLIEEIRTAFFAHPTIEAQELILGITRYAMEALGLEDGELGAGKIASVAVFGCEGIADSKQKAIHFVLHCQKQVQKLLIHGENYETITHP